MKKFAVIVAGGTGSRMGSETPKQFLELQGKTLFVHSAEAFLRAFADIHIILVLPAPHLEKGMKLMEAGFDPAAFSVTEGGSTRFESVKKGLMLAERPSIIFVHDAVRCLVSPALIRRCYDQALSQGSAIPAVKVRDSLKLIHGRETGYLDREAVRSIQTPQTFHSEILIPAFEQPYQLSFTDEATVVENAGRTTHLVEGEESNIKITFPLDLQLAELILLSRANSGSG
jgi:2-C-methyl-D-erythritol 4-phosphate cytidylyltransferase